LQRALTGLQGNSLALCLSSLVAPLVGPLAAWSMGRFCPGPGACIGCKDGSSFPSKCSNPTHKGGDGRQSATLTRACCGEEHVPGLDMGRPGVAVPFHLRGLAASAGMAQCLRQRPPFLLFPIHLSRSALAAPRDTLLLRGFSGTHRQVFVSLGPDRDPPARRQWACAS
jgi:hypothetical protein